MLRLCLPLAVIVILAACESGTSRSVDVVIPDAVAQGYSAEAPGVVAADLARGVVPMAALCGQTEAEPLTVYVDDGFGCLREIPAERGDEQRVTAWVEPSPATWGPADICAASRDRNGVLGLPEPGAGGLAASPDEAWDQGSATGVWSRDGSPCGGRLEGGEVVVQ